MFIVLWTLFLVSDVVSFELILQKLDDSILSDYPHLAHTIIRCSMFCVALVYAICMEISFSDLKNKRNLLSVISAVVIMFHVGLVLFLVAGRLSILNQYKYLFTEQEFVMNAEYWIVVLDVAECKGKLQGIDGTAYFEADGVKYALKEVKEAKIPASVQEVMTWDASKVNRLNLVFEPVKVTANSQMELVLSTAKNGVRIKTHFRTNR